MTNSSVHSGPHFDASVERDSALCIVHAGGELDVATAPLLSEVLNESADASTQLLVIDLTGVTLLDSTGLGVLIEHLGQLKQDGERVDLRLVVREPQVLKVFSITGLDQIFSIFPTIEEATALAV